MKKIATILAFAPAGLFAQPLVSQFPQNRTALFEEFAWVECGWCPGGKAVIDQLEVEHPNDFVPVTMHGGSTAPAIAGHPDFRNEWAAELFTYYGVPAWPRAVVDRHAVNGQTLQSTLASWPVAVDSVLVLPSPVNIGLSSTFDPNSRAVSVYVELYYTADSPGGNDFISVLVKESHIIGYQQDYVNGPQTDFDHTNILRAYLTPVFGDEVLSTTAGTLVQRMYTYILPAEWNVANCQVVAFVGEDHEEVYQAREVNADGGITTAISEPGPAAADIERAYPVPANDQVTIPILAVEQGTTIRVMDSAGRAVLSLRIGTYERLEMNTIGLDNGIYQFTITTARTQRCGRLVIRH